MITVMLYCFCIYCYVIIYSLLKIESIITNKTSLKICTDDNCKGDNEEEKEDENKVEIG